MSISECNASSFKFSFNFLISEMSVILSAILGNSIQFNNKEGTSSTILSFAFMGRTTTITRTQSMQREFPRHDVIVESYVLNSVQQPATCPSCKSDEPKGYGSALGRQEWVSLVYNIHGDNMAIDILRLLWWWRPDMEMPYALQAICERFLHKGAIIPSFDSFVFVSLTKLFEKSQFACDLERHDPQVTYL